MLLELFTTLLEDIQTAVPEFKRVDRYKFEFEEGTDWDPEFPICLMRYDGIKPNPGTVIADGSYTKAYAHLTLFIGDEDINSPIVLAKVEKVQSLFVNSFITITVESVNRKFNITLSENGTELHGYVKGVEVYRVGLKIEIPYKLIQLVAEPPEQVTLVSPANGAESIDINNADLEWNDAGAGVTGYDAVISTSPEFANEIFRVSKYNYLKLTVPDDLLVNETIYYWKVRAKGSGINGAWSEVRSFTTGSVQLEYETTLWLSGLATQPSTANILARNTLILNLKQNNLFSKVDGLLIYRKSETEEHALKNWIPNKPKAVPVNNPVFNSATGYTFNGVNNYIKTGFVPAHQLNFSQNNGGAGIKINNNITELLVDLGSSAPFILIYTRGNSSGCFSAMNDAGSTPSVSVPTSAGYTALDRQASGSYKVYKNGIHIATHAFASTGTAIYELYNGARNNAGVADRFSTKTTEYLLMHKGLNDAEHALLYSLIEGYVNA